LNTGDEFYLIYGNRKPFSSSNSSDILIKKIKFNEINEINRSDDVIPADLFIQHNYPNLFDPATTIRYSIPKSGYAKLSIFDISGKNIQNLINDEKAAGTYKVKFNCRDLASGIYIYQLQSGNFCVTKKMVLLR